MKFYLGIKHFFNKTVISKPKRRSLLFSLNIITGLLFLVSCGSAKNATYFNKDANMAFANRSENLDPIIQKNDLLSIIVSSINPDAAKMFNVANDAVAQSSTNAGNTTRVSGYLVGQDGFIRLPILGKVEAVGKTKNLLREEITTLLINRKLLLEPIVDIRYLNYKVSILGEVKNPSVLTIPSEKISILEALGLAGDITIFGRRDNITLIREENGVKRMRIIDLTSNEIFSSPYYYLKSNDIIYVQPNNAKVASSSGIRDWIPVILSAISLTIIAVINLK
ncbi:polysaccharide biosynthesis/export family protein [Zobellia laminariae]|uniref:polysaccharide biosynthesis/export family protein n=1 Tax=Zobellia laminariae TaxID=248906 RepID=UPI0026F460D5|nr:polysaccharide biosynthesis/export family protein [Zobellia laminariae]WKX78339.1 polysaccharide biosynthesis/export family protein [Zobellia laminariae]